MENKMIDKNGQYIFTCSICKGIFIEDYSTAANEYKYCPHCGTKFGGKNENESQ